ncbi:MAG: hypothetical protein WC412_07375 [Candidatus Omnitrophota bacterium]|jgi:hypothetical protein
MIKLSKIALFILCLMMVATLSLASSFAQDVNTPSVDQPTGEVFIKEGFGEIISVDTAASTVIAKISKDENEGVYDEVSFFVDEETMITSQDSTWGIADLKAGNKVTLVYETTADGKNVAKSILVF